MVEAAVLVHLVGLVAVEDLRSVVWVRHLTSVLRHCRMAPWLWSGPVGGRSCRATLEWRGDDDLTGVNGVCEQALDRLQSGSVVSL